MYHAYHEQFDYYEERADGLLASAADGTDSAVAAFARYDAPLTQDGARTVVAREHGQDDWEALRHHVAGLRESGEPFARAYRAVEAHDLDELRALLEQFPELARARGTNGNDLLGMAGATCDERLVELLLAHGADVAAANAHGWTALHQAAYSNLPRMARMLLDAGAPTDVSARGDGGTPLVIALFWGHRETSELLADARDPPAATCARPRAWDAPSASTTRTRPRTARTTARTAASGRGRRPTTRRRRSTRPSRGRRAMTAWRPSTRWSPAAPRSTGTSTAARRSPGPPRAAARRRSGGWSSSASIPTRTRTFGGPDHGVGVTALHLAAQNGDLDTIRTLLELGADPMREDDLYHATPAGWAEHGGHPEAVALIGRP